MTLPLVDRLAAPLADADLAVVGEHLDPDPDRPVAAAAHEQHVREVERALALDDAALTQPLRGTLVLLDHVDLLDQHPPVTEEDAQHLASLAALLARDDGDRVAPTDVARGRHQMTSGASEMIFAHCRARSPAGAGADTGVSAGV